MFTVTLAAEAARYENFRTVLHTGKHTQVVAMTLQPGEDIGAEVHPDNDQVLVFTDSKYVVDSVQKGWVFNWEKKGFKEKKNPDLWIQFLKEYRKHQVQFKWIKGHNNHVQNERCDVLAVEASKAKRLLIDEGFVGNGDALFP